MTHRRTTSALLLAVAGLALLAGCDDDDPAGDVDGASELTIVLDDPEGDPVRRSWTLGCDPPSGDLDDPVGACDALAALEDPWSPVPPDVACTEIFGGPQLMTISGRFDGEPIEATFSRSNGCEIARFDRVADALGIPVG